MDSKQKSLWIHCPICGGKTRTKVYEDQVPALLSKVQAGDFDRRGKTENGSQQRAGRLKHRACYPIFYREQALFGAYNFVSFVTQQ